MMIILMNVIKIIFTIILMALTVDMRLYLTGDHIDYIVDGRLHQQHEDHCDDHGAVDLQRN